jgi:DNA-binding transcriptional LysR family regulator
MSNLRLTLRQLQVFAAVAAAGSTAAASEEIALSQSATSSAVNELERALGLRLFDRVGKRLQLNENGRALLPRSRVLLDAAQSIEQLAGDDAGLLQSLRIGASTTVGSYLLPPLLARFLGDRPARAGQWHSTVTVGNTAAICDAVASFELDVGLVEGPSHHPALKVRRWRQDKLSIVAAPGMPGFAGASTGLRALREAVWLVREPGSGTREATDQVLLPTLGHYRRCIELGSSEAIKHAAAEGLGIACLSQWVAQDLLAAGRLRALRTPLTRLTRQYHLVLHRDKHLTPALKRFIDLVLGEADALA